MTKEFIIQASYDLPNDILYLFAEDKAYADTVALSDDLIIDVDEEGSIIGVELHYASEAFDISKKLMQDLQAVKGTVEIKHNYLDLHLKVISTPRNNVCEKGNFTVKAPVSSHLNVEKQSLATA